MPHLALISTDARVKFRRLHVHARQFIAFILIGNSPFPGLLVDDEGPFVCGGHREERVIACRNGLAANNYIAAANEGGCFVRPGAPDFAERYEVAINLTSFHARAGIGRLDGLSSTEIALRGRCWTGFAALAGRKDGERENHANDKGNAFLHGLSFVELLVLKAFDVSAGLMSAAPLCRRRPHSYNRRMPVFEEKREELEHYETMMGVPRGRLAVTMDAITDAMALVGQHGVYCQSQRWPGKPVMDIQIIMKSLSDAKELIQSVMEELKDKR